MSNDIAITENCFVSNYRILKEIAEELRNQSEPNIDELIPKIETAMKAYQICKEPLNHVSETLSKMLPEQNT